MKIKSKYQFEAKGMKAVQWMGIGFASAVLFASLACLFTK